MFRQFSQKLSGFFSFFLLIAVLGLMTLSSCRTDRYNKVTADTEDYRKGDDYVYGEGPDAEPRQTQNEYANTPESEKRAIDLRKKMFDQEKPAAPVEVAPEANVETPADTVAVPATEAVPAE